MMYYIYALVILCMYVATENGASSREVSDTTFTQQERCDAHAFIDDTLAWLKEYNQDKMDDAVKRNDIAQFVRYKDLLEAICELTWDVYDEQQARKMYHDVLLTPAWKSYIRQPTSLPHWGVIYRDMYAKHTKILAYHLKIKVPDMNKEFTCRLNAIMYLTTFLLNEQFKRIKKIQAEVQRTREDAGMGPSDGAAQQARGRQNPSTATFQGAARQQQVQAYKALPPQTREHTSGLQRVAAYASLIQLNERSAEVLPKCDVTVQPSLSSKQPEQSFFAAVSRIFSNVYFFISAVTVDIGQIR